MGFVKNCKTIRPLLSVSRFETGKLCSYWQLPIYPDKSNQKTKFLRNRIRKQIVPLIKLFFNSKIENVLLQLSEIVEAENRHMDQVANDLVSSSLLKKSIPSFNQALLSTVRKGTLLPLPTLLASQLLTLSPLPQKRAIVANRRWSVKENMPVGYAKVDLAKNFFTFEQLLETRAEILPFVFLDNPSTDQPPLITRILPSVPPFPPVPPEVGMVGQVGMVVTAFVLSGNSLATFITLPLLPTITNFFSNKKDKGKIVRKQIVLGKESGKTIGFFETTQYFKIVSTSNLLERQVRRLIDCTLFTPFDNLASDGPFFTIFDGTVKRWYNPDLINGTRDKIVESFVFPRNGMPVRVNFWLWNKRLYETKTLKEKTKDIFLCKKHINDCKGKEKEFFPYANTNLRIFPSVEYSYGSVRDKLEFNLNQASRVEHILLGRARFCLTAPLLLQYRFLPYAKQLAGLFYNHTQLCKPCQGGVYRWYRSVCWKMVDRQAWKAVIVENGTTKRTKYSSFNRNSFVSHLTKSSLESLESLEGRERIRLANMPKNIKNLSYTFFRDKEKGQSSSKSREKGRCLKKEGVKKQCFVPLNQSTISTISREKHFDCFLLFQFFFYFDALKSEKKDIYGPLLFSFLPTVFQRRVARLLLNQNWEKTNYTQIEKFLAFQKTYKRT